MGTFPSRDRIVVAALILGGPALIACGLGGGPSHYEIEQSTNCSSATGKATTCQTILTNAASSSGSFDWTASSDSPVASVSPPSGSVAKGATSEQITIRVQPTASCPVRVTFTGKEGGSVQVTVNSVNGKRC